MKRDMDLVRAILLKTEQADSPIPVQEFTTDEWDIDLVAYHVNMMAEEAKLIKGRALFEGSYEQGDRKFLDGKVFNLTWDGQDYLDAVRNDSIWSKTKEAIRKSAGSTTFEVVKIVAAQIGEKLILNAVGLG